MDILKAARVIWSKLLLALLAACFLSSVLYDLTGLERQASIQTYLKTTKEIWQKESHQEQTIRIEFLKKKKKKKLNNLYNYTPTFAFKTHTFAWDDSVFSFKVT